MSLPVFSLSFLHLLKGEKLPITSSASFMHDLWILGSPKMPFLGSSQFGIEGRVSEPQRNHIAPSL